MEQNHIEPVKKEILSGVILENKEIAGRVFRMVLRSPAGAPPARAGQFVNLYTNNAALLLPRPVSICDSDGETLTLVYGVVGKGTAEFSACKAGDVLRHSMPLGNGYRLEAARAGDSALLLGGGIGVPPLLKLCRELRSRGVRVTAVVGFKDEPFLTEELREAGAGLYVATDSGAAGRKGTVLDVVKQESLAADAYFACGPRPMLRAVCDYVLSCGKDIQLSMEERMGCGYGACVGCVCSVREKTDGRGEKQNGCSEKQNSCGAVERVVRKKVCKDGPVFMGSEVVWDAD